MISPEGHDDVELVLEPTGFPFAVTYQNAQFEAGIPIAAFSVDDIQEEQERSQQLGVTFHTKPTQMGPMTIAKFEDT